VEAVEDIGDRDVATLESRVDGDTPWKELANNVHRPNSWLGCSLSPDIARQICARSNGLGGIRHVPVPERCLGYRENSVSDDR